MRWARNLARKERSGIHTGSWWKIQKEIDRQEERMGEGNIKMDLRERGLGDRDWIDLAQGSKKWRALLNTAVNFRVP
jgi:hypothetical protein